ncbi:flagellar basal body-associated protein FliL [Halomonas heilongjiangensis]|uniref:Flagellar protein FliL n=1 Tax=Halomonas heilongjiangensis TaxID=1387883 RepID=A0A2N7TQM6_9GAMM|nr:flagellar basal body-associated protein FliL [Halomonas heilongjiangensis]PMR70500.1 flagellar basal body-associated protein FliL [Halomonas heilongjiangensis]PXX92907.1 flagellar basal body-associated protein FliL [Halomonas heilongjiangensis]
MATSTGGSRKLLWLMVILVVLSSSAAAAAIYLVLGQRPAADPAATQAEVVPERRAPIFVKIDPFTVNLADDAYGSRLLYAGLSLKVGDDETREILEAHMPQVRSRLLMMFAGQQASELTGPASKQRLGDQVLAVLDPPMTDHQPELVIEDVLFTEFIVQ